MFQGELCDEFFGGWSRPEHRMIERTSLDRAGLAPCRPAPAPTPTHRDSPNRSRSDEIALARIWSSDWLVTNIQRPTESANRPQRYREGAGAKHPKNGAVPISKGSTASRSM